MKELEELSVGQVIKLKLWFDNYVDNIMKKNFNKRQNLELKRIHTYNVCKESLRIMQRYRKNQNCNLSSYIIALFHDVGRFEQYVKYNTFNDAMSENHAELSIKIMLENDLLKNVNSYTKNIIIKAIENHNKAYLPKINDFTLIFLSKVIRDADKIDIYRIITQNYISKKPNNAVNLELSASVGITENVYKSILTEQCVKYEDLKTITDLKILHLSWVYDINFTYTFERIKKESYLEKIYNVLPKTQDTQLVYQKVMDFVDQKLKVID